MRTAKHTLADLVDIDRLQRLFDSFVATGDIGLFVLDPGGTILVAAGWQDICTQFHRVHEDTLKGCLESDARINQRLFDGLAAPEHYAYQCANGLWDVAFPLIIAGEHLGNVFTGQFFYDDDEIDEAVFRQRAQRLGFDEAAYLEALARVPVLSHERVAQTIGFLVNFVGMLADLGLSALRQEQKHEALTQSEERLKEAQSIARLGRWELDLVSDRLHWSDGIFELFEIDPLRFGASYEAFLDAIHPDDRDAVDRAYSASLENKQPYEISHRLLMKDGRIKWVHEKCRTDFDAHGKPLRSIGVVQDVTERKLAEAELREARDYVENLFGYANAPVIVWDPELRITRFNHAFEELTGRLADEVVGKHLELLFPEDDRRPQALEHVMEASAGERWQVVEIPILRADGEVRTVLWNSATVCGADGVTPVATIAQGQDITERRHAEAALAENEDKFRYMFDHSAVPRSITQPSGEIEVNEAFLEMVGNTREEIGERATWQQLSHPDDVAPKDRIIASIISGERTSARFGHRYLHKNGSVIWADVSTALRRDADGSPDYFMTTIVDITERKHAEEALRESEEKYRGLFANAQVGMFRTRLDGSAVLAVNPKMCEIIGYTEEEILADPATIRWADPEVRTVMIQELQAAGSLKDYEFDIVHSSGEVRTVLGSMELRLEQGYLEGSATDITERKRAEEALLDFARRQSTLFDSLQDGLGVVDAAGVLLDVNPALCAMTGFSREELVGAGPPHPFWPPEESAAIGEAFAPAMRGETNESELTFMRKSGERFAVVVSPSSVKDSEGRVELMFATMKDATERKRAEEEIRTLNAELEQRVLDRTMQLDAANKELEAFAYSVSHDLRAPLRHISGFSSLLAERVGDSLDEKSSHYVDTISRSVREMGVLIDDLLQFSRTGRAELQITDVDMEQALAEALLPLQHETEGRAIEWQIGRLPTVVGDHALLRQVWANLLGNAVKFSRGRSPARIEVGAHDGDEADEDVFYVRDNGVGFDMEYVHKLFGVFQRLHGTAEFEGTGIGLANVQRIISRLGGRVWAEGEVDHGATFSFSLPRRKDSPS